MQRFTSSLDENLTGELHRRIPQNYSRNRSVNFGRGRRAIRCSLMRIPGVTHRQLKPI